MPNVDFTLEDLKRVFVTKDEVLTLDNVRSVVRDEIVNERSYTRQLMQEIAHESKKEILGEVGRIREMLEDDARAESKRLDKVDRRSAATKILLKKHMADNMAHGRTAA